MDFAGPGRQSRDRRKLLCSRIFSRARLVRNPLGSRRTQDLDRRRKRSGSFVQVHNTSRCSAHALCQMSTIRCQTWGTCRATIRRTLPNRSVTAAIRQNEDTRRLLRIKNLAAIKSGLSLLLYSALLLLWLPARTCGMSAS